MYTNVRLSGNTIVYYFSESLASRRASLEAHVQTIFVRREEKGFVDTEAANSLGKYDIITSVISLLSIQFVCVCVCVC